MAVAWGGGDASKLPTRECKKEKKEKLTRGWWWWQEVVMLANGLQEVAKNREVTINQAAEVAVANSGDDKRVQKGNNLWQQKVVVIANYLWEVAK